ncbi:MAG: hypothetical protein GF347_05655, partial [Candidatus Moranbacteria bacterium]|nr:hypothetical protein [Candidatus Moranbacteria bacterium]
MTITDDIPISHIEDPSINLKYCPECSGSIIYDSRTYSQICDTCGLIITEHNIVAHKRRVYNSLEKETRTSTGPLYSILSGPFHLSTKIDVNASFHNRTFLRLKKIDQQIESQERTQSDGLNYLLMLSNKFNTQDHVKLFAFKLFLLAKSKGLIKGRAIKDIIITCFYLSYRKHKLPILFFDLLSFTNIHKGTLLRYSRLLIRELNLKLYPINIIDLAYYLCSKLNLNFISKKKIIDAMKIIRDNFVLISGKNPVGFIAAVIYLTIKKNKNRILTQKEITSKFGLTEFTLQNRLKDINRIY